MYLEERPFHMNRIFAYDVPHLANKVATALLRPGGYANLLIATSSMDTHPVKYYYRNAYLGPHLVYEGADNGVQRKHVAYTDAADLLEKLFALIESKDFYSVEFMNKAVSREYEKVYAWQVDRRS